MEKNRLHPIPSVLVRILFAASAALLAAVLGCAGPMALDPSSGPIDVVLRAGEQRDLASWDRLAFERVVGDSRCPIGTTCVWAGAAQARVWIRTHGGKTESAELTVGADSTVSPPVELGAYRLRGVRLDPYPRAQQTIHASDYRLTLRIELAKH